MVGVWDFLFSFWVVWFVLGRTAGSFESVPPLSPFCNSTEMTSEPLNLYTVC